MFYPRLAGETAPEVKKIFPHHNSPASLADWSPAQAGAAKKVETPLFSAEGGEVNTITSEPTPEVPEEIAASRSALAASLKANPEATMPLSMREFARLSLPVDTKARPEATIPRDSSPSTKASGWSPAQEGSTKK